MNKMLFTDGTNGVRDVQSQEELELLITSSRDKDKIRIWVFSSNEWIGLAAFSKQFPDAFRKAKNISTENNQKNIEATVNTNKSGSSRWLKKSLYTLGVAIITFLVFNFTKIKWKEAEQLTTSAIRPANVPPMDMDSLIVDIETARGQAIDKHTKANLRMRNTWPERILLQLKSDKESTNGDSRFFNIDVMLDNTTGFTIDKAIVKISVWNSNKVTFTDTLAFNNIKYDKPIKRELDYKYKGDSLSVSFESIKAKAFNFCYSAATKNNSGNYNDRWFCRE